MSWARVAGVKYLPGEQVRPGKQDAETQQDHEHLQHPDTLDRFQPDNPREQPDQRDHDANRAERDADLRVFFHRLDSTAGQPGPQYAQEVSAQDRFNIACRITSFR
jgi:hypothetical protein